MRAVTVGLIMFAYAVALGGSAAYAQSTPPPERARPELAIAYNYEHSNAPAGGCGCFSLNGGSATFAFPLQHASLSVVGDVSVSHAGAVPSTREDLTLSTFTGGVRYSPRSLHTPLRPFGEVLVGIAHAGGASADGSGSSISESSTTFASLIGGGVDLRVTHHFALRLIEADYLLTTFDNGSNNRQNNLRIGTGLVLHF